MTPNSNYHVLDNSVWATVTSVSLLTSIYYFWFIMQSFIHKIKDDDKKEGYLAISLFYLHVNNVGYCEYPWLWTKATSLYMCIKGLDSWWFLITVNPVMILSHISYSAHWNNEINICAQHNKLVPFKLTNKRYIFITKAHQLLHLHIIYKCNGLSNWHAPWKARQSRAGFSSNNTIFASLTWLMQRRPYPGSAT
jgi:hypothetical protein